AWPASPACRRSRRSSRRRPSGSSVCSSRNAREQAWRRSAPRWRASTNRSAWSAAMSSIVSPARCCTAVSLRSRGRKPSILSTPRPPPTHPLGPEPETQRASDRQPLLILDGVSNPHNLGAIARTAAFFGLPRMVLSDHPAQALPSDASYRVSEGGLEHLELHRAAR